MTEARNTKGPRIGVVGIPGRWSTESLADEFERQTGFRLVVDLGLVRVDLARARATFEGQRLDELDALVVKKIDAEYGWSNLDRIEMLRFIESTGVRIFSRPDSLIRLIDRLSCTVTLRAHGIPMPDTTITEDIAAGVDAVLEYGGAVLKPLYSTKARGMRLVDVRSRTQVRDEVEAFQQEGNPVMYIQRKLEMPDRDLAIAFIGGKYLASYARVSGGRSWNTTTHSGGHYARHEPSPEVIALAERAQGLFELDFTAVDVVEAEQGPLVFEVSAFGGFRGLKEGTGIEAARAYADYVIGSLRHAG